MKRFLNPVSLLPSLVALALVAGGLFAAQWQFSRGANQSAINKIIAANLDLPSLSMNEIKELDAVSNQWRKVTLQGSFSQDKQELVRNRYHEGKFGFEVLTLFTATNGENFWVDRGWVAAGPNAATPPIVEPVASGNLEITARIRSENLSRQLQGSFFVTRATSEKPESITKLQGVEANAYYLDLLDSPDKKVKLILTYPASAGRNFDEILRVIDSLQLTANYKVATPANWKHGEDVIIAGTVSDEDAKKLFPNGWKTVKPYLRTIKQPVSN